MTTDTNPDAGYGIAARKRVWAINHGRLPTVEDYHAALVQCLADKADEIERLRLTDAEREAIHHVVGDVADITGPVEDTLRRLLKRLGGDK